MVQQMKSIASMDTELSIEERNLLSVAYKNVIGARRASWRIVSSIEGKEESKGNTTQVGAIKNYREKIENELKGSTYPCLAHRLGERHSDHARKSVCEDILKVLDDHLLKSAQSGESKVSLSD